MNNKFFFSAVVGFLLFTSYVDLKKNIEIISPYSPPPPISQTVFEQYPPYAIQYWVQKLKTPTGRGENIIFKVKYESDYQLPEFIDIYNTGTVDFTLSDDGNYPDDVRGDGKYAALRKENLTQFTTQIQNREHWIQANGGIYDFTGHSGEFINRNAIPLFDFSKFNLFQETEINALLINAGDCQNELKKEKSLFITDLSVVEDESRTYNVKTGVGNSNGVWTFGKLMDNIENNTHADGLRGFLKEWVKTWLVDQTVNGQVVKSRAFALDSMIIPWIRKAKNNPNFNPTFGSWEQEWENEWNAISETNLKINAPFKLTAIVNRLDLKGNVAYTSSVSNAGETRFIFTLINPFTGKVPIAPTQSLEEQINNPDGFIDWRGMNIIFEYGNIQTTACQVNQLTQQWANLSDGIYSFGQASTDNPYKVALQSITDLVTGANAAPAKPNGSAINSIRTNEKMFATFLNPPLNGDQAWEAQDWEFRQFNVDASTHKLKLVPLTNNPPHFTNYAPNIDETSYGVSSNHAIIDWIYSGHKNQVYSGNFNLPTSLLAGSGLVRREQSQYFDLDPVYLETKSGAYDPNNDSQEAKRIRQQLSLNTCVGCHAGETKVRFTHINPMKYGEVAQYWNGVLSGINGVQDGFFYPNSPITPPAQDGFNEGFTDDAVFGFIKNFEVSKEIVNHSFFQNISPFLVGARKSVISASATWKDDDMNDSDDDNFNGLYFVNDPSNKANDPYYFPGIHTKKWGYNDLLMRKQRLCTELINGCNGAVALTVFQSMTIIDAVPMPLGAH